MTEPLTEAGPLPTWCGSHRAYDHCEDAILAALAAAAERERTAALFTPDELDAVDEALRDAGLDTDTDLRERVRTALGGICPVCRNLFRLDGHSFDCPLGVNLGGPR